MRRLEEEAVSCPEDCKDPTNSPCVLLEKDPKALGFNCLKKAEALVFVKTSETIIYSFIQGRLTNDVPSLDQQG